MLVLSGEESSAGAGPLRGGQMARTKLMEEPRAGPRAQGELSLQEKPGSRPGPAFECPEQRHVQEDEQLRRRAPLLSEAGTAAGRCGASPLRIHPCDEEGRPEPLPHIIALSGCSCPAAVGHS